MSVLMHAIRKHVAYYLNFPIGQILNMGQFWNLVVKVCDVNRVCLRSLLLSAADPAGQFGQELSWLRRMSQSWKSHILFEKGIFDKGSTLKRYQFSMSHCKEICGMCLFCRPQNVNVCHSVVCFWWFKSIWKPHPLGLLQFSLNTNEEQMREYECQYLIQHILI